MIKRESTENTYLDFSVFENISQVLGDAVIRSQVLFRKVDSLLVLQDRSRVRLQELLFNAHIMVSNRQHGSSVFVGLWGH